MSNSNTLQSAKDFTQSSITTSETGMKSLITQTSNSVIAQVNSINLINNSEFDNVTGTFAGWHMYTPWGASVTNQLTQQDYAYASVGNYLWPQASKMVSHNYSTSTPRIYSDPIRILPNKKLSGSLTVANPASATTNIGLAIYIVAFDTNQNQIGNIWAKNITAVSGAWTVYSFDGAVTPAGTVYVSMGFTWNDGMGYFGQPMLQVNNTYTGYTPNVAATSTVLSLFKDNWSIGISDNIGNITSGIVGNSNSMSLISKNIVLDGNTTVTGDFYAKGGNFKNLNASNMTVGTLNGTQVNITNINANNIVSGAISGANLNINLNTGSVVFQKGRINSSDYTTDINIDQGYISTSDEITRALLTQGKLQLIESTLLSPQTNPYLEISNNSSLFNGMAALIKARDSLTVSINGYSDRGYNTQMSTEKFVGLSIGKYNNQLMPTKIGGAKQGVIISGGKQYNDIVGTSTPYIFVGSDSNGTSPNGDRIYLNGKAVHIPSAYNTTWSASANVYIASDGSLYRASSAKKYKQDIKHNVPLSDSKKLLEIPLSTWIDKRQYREKNDETRYFGMIAEDLRDAGLEYLVQYGEDNEVEGINYDRVALLLIPLVKELKERIEELESEGK